MDVVAVGFFLCAVVGQVVVEAVTIVGSDGQFQIVVLLEGTAHAVAVDDSVSNPCIAGDVEARDLSTCIAVLHVSLTSLRIDHGEVLRTVVAAARSRVELIGGVGCERVRRAVGVHEVVVETPFRHSTVVELERAADERALQMAAVLPTLLGEVEVLERCRQQLLAGDVDAHGIGSHEVAAVFDGQVVVGVLCRRDFQCEQVCRQFVEGLCLQFVVLGICPDHGVGSLALSHHGVERSALAQFDGSLGVALSVGEEFCLRSRGGSLQRGERSSKAFGLILLSGRTLEEDVCRVVGQFGQSRQVELCLGVSGQHCHHVGSQKFVDCRLRLVALCQHEECLAHGVCLHEDGSRLVGDADHLRIVFSHLRDDILCVFVSTDRDVLRGAFLTGDVSGDVGQCLSLEQVAVEGVGGHEDVVGDEGYLLVDASRCAGLLHERSEIAIGCACCAEEGLAVGVHEVVLKLHLVRCEVGIVVEVDGIAVGLVLNDVVHHVDIAVAFSKCG